MSPSFRYSAMYSSLKWLMAMLMRPLFSKSPTASPILACSTPSSLKATPASDPISLKLTVALIAIEIVRLPIIGDKEIKLAIVVEVRPHSSQAKVVFGVVDPGFRSDLGKSAVAVVVIERIGRSLQATRPALHGDFVILAGLCRTEQRQIVEIEVDVMRDKEIGKTIAVVVPKRNAGRPARVF